MKASWLAFSLAAFQGSALGVALALGLHFALILGTPNLHTVIPGQVYRAAQPSSSTLSSLVRRQGVRSVINLRGCCPHLDWYQRESRETALLELDQEDIAMSASRLPSAASVRQLIEAFDRAAYPLVLHCQQGVDRTGLAAACALLLMTDTPLVQARRQMSLEMGHVRLGRTRFIGRFFDYYELWLDNLELAHTPTLFRLWATRHYAPGTGRSMWELIGPGTDVPARAVTVLHVRATNQSLIPWHFRPGNNLGVHARWYLDNDQGYRVASGGMGFFEALVAPGESIDLRVSLPGLAPGRYSLLIELADEVQASFTQLGDDPLVLDLLVS